MNGAVNQLIKISEKTNRTERLWLKGRKVDMSIYRIPIKHLYFNIENGRYADKMLQLRADNPGVDIDPKNDKWKEEIYKMLKGEYRSRVGSEGTERDKGDFERLRGDIKERDQLAPGIVLSDGGVIDGNRRLAVLMSLGGRRFSHFDGVILPEDVDAEDRWRIEVGLQLGKEQKLDYSPVNQLLKIREGLKLFRDEKKLPSGKTAEEMVADALYGVSRKEVLESIDRLNLIEEYLDFFNMNGQYQCVSDRSEQFIEAVKVLKAAEKLKPYDKSKIKSLLFVVIREGHMSNYDIRKIRKALGGVPKRRGPKSRPIQKAIDHLIEHATDPKMVREAYVKGSKDKIVDKSETISKEFVDIVDAEDEANRPLTLARDARTKLEVLQTSLKDLLKPDDAIKIKDELQQIKKVIRACLSTVELPKYRRQTKL